MSNFLMLVMCLAAGLLLRRSGCAPHEAMKKIVESLPFHARYIIKVAEFERYVEPF